MAICVSTTTLSVHQGGVTPIDSIVMAVTN